MKITSIEALHLRVEDLNIGLFDGSHDDCVIVIHTNEGIVGLGETESFPAAIRPLIDGPSAHNHARGLEELPIGRDPTDPKGL